MSSYFILFDFKNGVTLETDGQDLFKVINGTGTKTNPYLPENKTYKDDFKRLKTIDETGAGTYKPKSTKQDINRFRVQTSDPKLFGQ
jgi:hypothetical protein